MNCSGLNPRSPGWAPMAFVELRKPDDIRSYLLAGLRLARIAPPEPDLHRHTLLTLLELAHGGQPVPPPGFVADLAWVAMGMKGEPATPGSDALGPGLARGYDDYVLGKLLTDSTLQRAADALRLAAGRDVARGLGFLVERLQARLALPGVHLAPASVKAVSRESPESLAAGVRSVNPTAVVAPLWQTLYPPLVAAFRQAPALLGPEDLFELERGTALQEMGQRLALRQIVRASAQFDINLPVQRPRPRQAPSEVATHLMQEDAFPVGGFASLTTRGTMESLLQSQLAYMETNDRPDLFDVKYLRDELLYYSRDENLFLRPRQTFVFVFTPGLAAARFKDPGAPYQRLVLALAWVVSAIRKLLQWLRSDALAFHLVFLEDQTLSHEKQLLTILLAEQIANGTVAIDQLTLEQLTGRCGEWARRSHCKGVCLATTAEAWDMAGVDWQRLVVDGPEPRLQGHNLDRPPDEDAWAWTLTHVLHAWA